MTDILLSDILNELKTMNSNAVLILNQLETNGSEERQTRIETNAIRQSFPVIIRKAAADHSKQS